MGKDTAALRCAQGLLLYLLTQALLVPAWEPLAGWLGLGVAGQAVLRLLWRAACAALPIAYLWQGLQKPADAGASAKTAPAWVFIPLFIGCMLVGNPLAMLLQGLFGPAQAGQSMANYTSFTIALTLLTSVCLPAVAEELFFRGCVQGLLQPFGRGVAVAASALLFTLAHVPGWDAAAVLLCGLALALVRQGTGRLWPCVLLHLANNLLAFITGWLGGSAGTVAAIVLLALAVMLLPLAVRRIRQSGVLAGGAKGIASFRQLTGQPLLLLAMSAFLVVFMARAFI